MKLAVALLAVVVFAFPARAADNDDNLDLLVTVIASTDDPAAQADMLRGLAAALEGKKNVKMPAGWAQLSPKLAASPNAEVKTIAAKLSAAFGDVSSLDAFKKTAADAKAAPAERVKAIESLLAKPDASLAPLFQSLLADKAPGVAESAIKGLGTLPEDARTSAALFDAYKGLDADAQRAALNLLSFKKGYARQLVDAIKANKVPPKDLTAYTVRQLRNHEDKDIDAFVTATWGVARTTPQAKLDQVAQYKRMLAPEALAKADPKAGRAIFAKTCQQCHTLFGEGGKVGPDITGSNRTDIDYLMVNIVDPSAVIPKDYQVTNVYLKDNDVISGILTQEDAESVTIVTESTNTRVERKEIDTIKKSELSMMPEGLLLPLSKTEMLNLIAYLRSPSQVPLP
ncbi:MAG: c-type cytochrome [Phycisphaerae bacterium]|nr:c-type cytochrome [Tepidisphaeraceae bacterium]